MDSNWIESEFATIDLKDKRLNKRFKSILANFESNPTQSIPQSCLGWQETKAPYRFFENENVNWEAILTPHFEAALTRMSQHPVVLCLQDTTELNFNGRKTEGADPLTYETQTGMYLHPTFAITPDREPLGVIDAWMWSREPKKADGTRDGVLESTRWIEGLERISEQTPRIAETTRLVYVADREGDIVELFNKNHDNQNKVDWLIRSKHNRNLAKKNDVAETEEDKKVEKLWQATEKTEALGQVEFTHRKRGQTKARQVIQTIHQSRQTLPGQRGIEVTCIIANEENPPSGVKPVVWRFITNRLISTKEEAVELIDWYRARWEIEIFFNVLKNGCTVEELQLTTIDRMHNAICMYMVVAWRIMRLMRLGRLCPDLPANLFFDEDEIKCTFLMLKEKPPTKTPKLNEVVRKIAMLGGFLGRKSDGEPGVESIWTGLSRVRDSVFTLEAIREFGI